MESNHLNESHPPAPQSEPPKMDKPLPHPPDKDFSLLWKPLFDSLTQFSADFMEDGRSQPPLNSDDRFDKHFTLLPTP
jgi:hypothetical protein